MTGKAFFLIGVFLLVFAVNIMGGISASLTSFAFYLYIIPVVLAAYLYGMKTAMVINSLVLFHGIAAAIAAGSIMPDLLLLIFLGIILVLTCKIVAAFDGRLSGILECNEKKLEKVNESYGGLSAKAKELLSRNRELEKKETQLAELYEISKAMGKSLAFKEILGIMRDAVHETFQFDKGTLFLRCGKQSKDFDFMYSFDSGEMTENVKAERPADLQRVMREKKPLFITPDGGKKTFFGGPILLSNKSIGVAMFENFALSSKENFALSSMEKQKVKEREVWTVFSILATQFALQMQKAMLYEEVEKLAITDGLTGVALRRYFLQRFDEELNRSQHHNLPLSFLMIDIDHFKNYNDKYGHLVGDAVLKETVKILQLGIREVDLIGRYGGEEFCIMLPETDKEGGYEAGERIRSLVENNEFKVYDEKTSITVSVGVSNFPVDADTDQKLIDNADKALFKAKESGRNRVCKY